MGLTCFIFRFLRRPLDYRDRLRRLGIEQIDLYYVHRIDSAHPIEDTMAGLAQLGDVSENGK